jgi:hypothetical protein
MAGDVRPTRAEAIKTLLEKRTHPDLAALYHAGMEVQVNVGRDGGTPVKDDEHRKGKAYRDDSGNMWYSFRIPKHAMSEPEDNGGKEMTYPLGQHAEAIGMTGWCFSTLRSMWVAFDFDAIIGHSERHAKKLTDAELAQVSEAAQRIPWVTVRRSTSGSGLHLYVFFAEPVPTRNHNEHAALGRAVLAMMSAMVGFDFQAKVDACGGNMWVWARKMVGTNGLTLVKKGDPMVDIPADWQSHVRVVRGERKKSLPSFIEEGMEQQPDLDRVFDELSGQHPHVRLDDEHRKLIEWLQANQGWGWWDADHHMLVTHTAHLKRAHEALQMRGVFETLTPATQPDEQNCFCFPMRNGAWSVRRYTMGVAEAPTWEQDGRGYTRCYLNRNPDLGSVARARGGVEVEKGGFIFREAEVAASVVNNLGGNVKIDPSMITRPARLKMHKDGKRIVFEIDQSAHDDAKRMEGWYPEKGKWQRIFNAQHVAVVEETEVGVFDNVVRHTVTESRMDSGWYIRVDEHWHWEPKGHVQIALISLGKKKPEVDALMGASVRKPWVIVSRPFQEEYPGDRLWNRSRAQYRYPRSEEIGEFPHWKKVLTHIGKGLDVALAAHGWAQANDVKIGYEYLCYWLASALQFPYEPLPFLFLYGNQNCGKSIFWEMLDFLVTDGIVEANNALGDKERFNAELEGAVFCYLEEISLKKNKQAYERIKNWVTSPKLMIHKKNLTPYPMPNTTHWIHCANDHDACPVFPGDSRVTMINVPDLTPGEMIPKEELKGLLKREAPHFLNYLLQLEVPPTNDRLRIPIVMTSEKEVLQQSNRSSLEEFIENFVHHAPGEMVLFGEFYAKFWEWIGNNYPQEQSSWTKPKIGKNLPPHFPVGTKGGNSYIGNMSWEPVTTKSTKKLILKDRILVPIEG